MTTTTQAIKPKRDDTMLSDWQSTPEKAPSVMLEGKPALARFLFVAGLLLSAVGALSLLAIEWDFRYLVSPGWGLLFLTFGLTLVLVHAFIEKDEQFRRAYAMAALMIIGLSALLRVLKVDGAYGGRFLVVGFPGLCLGLLLIGAVLRHETNQVWRAFLNRILILLGSIIILSGIVEVNMHLNRFVGEGVILMILGLFFAMVSMTHSDEKLAYFIGVGLGSLGLSCIVIGVVRWMTIGMTFAIPSGVALISVGLVYLAVYLGVVSDWPIVVLTRREFSSFFYTPVAYPVLLGLVAIAWINFALYVGQYLMDRQPIPEPIVQFYIIALIPVIAQMFVVPMLTMRLLSEEKRDGTLEVLLTAPVNEISVVLGKFFGSMGLYLLTWVPMWIFLVSLWVTGGEQARFDYRPVLSFFLAVIATGSGFMAMGLFCSAITRNQIIAAELSFAYMVAQLAIYMLRPVIRQLLPALEDVISYVSYIDLWINSLAGLVAPRFLFFHFSVAIFFLFLTLKYLESRKWK